ncbi:MAG: DoxX family membrane protein, partial [Candidatus Eremiobacteraeota bacterium]|nr:DoxX family membrane protein [Candidatus Eremiobacteraeota bacterium]
ASESGFRADVGVAYAVLRLTMGANFFVHGGARLPHLAAFVAGTARGFEHTLLPAAVVVPFAYAIPFVEVAVGISLILGVGLRGVLPLAGLYMIALTFGTLLRADYLAVAEQLLYSLVFAILIALRSFDRFSVDRKFVARTPMAPSSR